MPLERILVVNLNQIGAVVLAVPVFKALKDAFPNARVATLVRDSMASLLDGNPYLDQVIGWDKKWPLSRKWETVRQMRREHFDTVINLSHSMERALLTRLSGARTRVGFNTSEAAFLHTIRVREKTSAYHATERNLDLVRALGVPAEGEDGFRIYVSDDERRWAGEFLRQQGVAEGETLIGLNPGASNALNRWDPDAFAELARLLMARGHRVAILGGPMDMEDGQAIVRLAPKEALHWTGRFNFRELGAILERTAVLVTADTGPMHMAVGLRTPLVVFFGPADPRWTGPYCGPRIIIQKDELPCIRCLKYTCDLDKKCLKLITPDEVLAAVERLLAERAEAS